MNHCEPRLTPRESLRTWRYLALLLLPMLDPTRIDATGRSRSTSSFSTDLPVPSAPYLLAIGAPPLRFQEFVPPPDLSIRPPAAGTSTPPIVTVHETSTPDVIVPSLGTLPPPDSTDTHTETKETAPAAKKPGPAPILPDETRPQIRAEDFLPFFQIPGSRRGSAEVDVVVPVPPTAPSSVPLTPSSATYRQTPR